MVWKVLPIAPPWLLSMSENQKVDDKRAVHSSTLTSMSSESMALAAIFAALRSPERAKKALAARELYDTVMAFSRESPQNSVRLNQEINKQVYDLIHSSEPSNRLGGVIAVDRLTNVDTPGVEGNYQSTRYATYLRTAIQTPDYEVMKAAAAAIGKMTQTGTLGGDIVEAEVNRCIEWLSTDRQEVRRQAAALEIRAIAKASPALMFGFISSVVEALWSGIRDPKIAIRQDSVDALGVCLDIVLERDQAIKDNLYSAVFNEAAGGLKSNITEHIHGALLVYRELLLHTGSFMQSKFNQTLEATLKLKDNKDLVIRRTVIEILPDFASFNPAEFTKSYLNETMSLFMSQLSSKSSSDKSLAFVSTGKLSLAVSTSMAPYLGRILEYLREALGAKARIRRELEGAVFKCLGMFAQAFGQAFTKFVDRSFLDLMFNCGLTRPLYECLQSLYAYIPALREEISDLLLDIISHALSGYSYKIPGSPNYSMRVSESLAREYRESMLARIGGDMTDTETLTNLILILSEFDFKDRMLATFCKDCVIKHTSNPDSRVRKAAAITCCRIFIKEPISTQVSVNALETVHVVLEKLLTVGVTDTSSDIRLEVLQAMGPKLDPHLAQPEHIKLLFMAMNDELFAIRQVAVSILGRLSKINPAYVIPTLRKTMIELLTNMEYSSNTRYKEESAKLLSTLMTSSKTLISPYVDPILKVLLPAAKNATVSTVTSSIMDAVGELSPVAGKQMLNYVDQIMPVVVDMLQDQASVVKRDTALRTLGKLASNSEYVIEPYYQYPNLLGTLIKILISDGNHVIQRNTVRLIGILGALDPYKYREVEHEADTNSEGEENNVSIDVKLVLKGTSPSNEDYNPTVAMLSLMTLLKDPASAPQHKNIIQAVVNLFSSLGMKSMLFLDKVIPGLLSSLHGNSGDTIEFVFWQLAKIIAVVKQHIRSYVDEIFVAINEYFSVPSLQQPLLVVIESLAVALDGEFKTFMPRLLPLLIGILQADDGTKSKIQVLNSLRTFGANFEEYIHLIIPNVVSLFYFSPQDLRVAALSCVSDLAQCLDLSEMASRIIHPLLRVMNSTNDNKIREVCMETLCNVCYQLGPSYAVFAESVYPTIQRIRGQVDVSTYDKLVHRILRNEPLASHFNPYRKPLDTHLDSTPASEQGKAAFNLNLIQAAWDATGRSTREDWTEWFRRLSVEFLKGSPSPALKACSNIATISTSLARDLFNPSFYTVWANLSENYKEDLIGNIQNAMASSNIPPEILQTLLTLAEFMERDDQPLPLTPRVLASYAQKCHAYAKALHYKELDFINDPSASTIESLISINNQLQQSDAAIGILKHAQNNHSLQLKETWYEKLGRWEDALAAYRAREKLEPDSMDVVMGKMRCLHALGEWDQLSKIAKDRWANSTRESRRAIAPLAAAAAWGLGSWEEMDTYINVMKPESPDRSFFNSILCLHRNNFEETAKQIQRARDQIITELTALVSESYNRAYGVVVRAQMLAELEEIMQYKMLPENAEEDRATIKRTWEKRLIGIQHNVDIWQRVLNVRTLLMPPKQNMEMWVKFANLCRKSNRIGLAEKSLNLLLDVDNESSRAPPQVVYAQLKFMWATGNQKEALKYLIDFTARMSHDLNLSNDDLISQPLPSELPGTTPEILSYTKLLARCFLKQGEWQVALNTDWKESADDKASILGSYLLATHFDRGWYKAWHNWALANFEVVSLYEHSVQKALDAANNENGNSTDADEDDEMEDTELGGGAGPTALVPGAAVVGAEGESHCVQAHVVPAIKGFFHSITLAHKSALQDTLRLLTLWFKYGGLTEPARAISEGFGMVNLEVWLEVTPQLISRIHQTDDTVRKALHGLLAELGKKHPQALVHPLQVSIKSDDPASREAAEHILDQVRSHSLHSSIIVEQADMVAHELIRVAVLWHEQWHEGLEDASRYFFVEHNIPKMFATLEPLHTTLEKGPTTLREMSFQTAFGRDLHDAYEWTQNFKRTNDMALLNQAWDIYYSVFRRISRQLPQLTSLDLQYVSPALQNAKNLDLAVPRTYEPDKPEITIVSFDPTFAVISSKQRPRRFTVRGSDGKDYQYVLKGHEDIRQDSLVMQLFGLVNTLLADNAECFKRHLSIHQYPAIPLSPKAGLLGWVPHSDTLHYLIREYRDGKSLLNIEHRIMIQMAPDYENLTHLQKIEVFTYALDNTKGQDLYRILWLKSRSSEAWLDRRTNYTRSLAVMSMVGYILGLGDRHPLNLMLDRISGRIVHIDFGDCFEAAILREKFPEKVPFRLTRMLTFAMEVSGVEGSYRITCEHVMALLRDNSESLMAILEAFSNDPLINWGFDLPNKKDEDERPGEEKASQVVADDGLTEDQKREAEIRNARAQLVLRRIRDKFTGNDFKRHRDLNVPDQVDLLIHEATNIENLCQHFIGWCSFW
ncbi:Serine/threonine-protein kinase TOR2 [Wickerhamiella sorbophila]|uniref:Serine/threonine-protein kinase TOR n=1 Tax=Wickerhamiella sorbophila TaxID=45607 RepID=A0A2T0FJ79_9ASCO|nr:Serine/threonine-protein kinase TOR2 [Wickerhamiella sorbophila]PRT55035.1 Serine/threonine-protein kinase TOR2 [Wickerhamiella sorbophila]